MNNEDQYEYVINARRITCDKCGSEQLKKYGKSPDGRQILKCYECNRKSTVNKRKFGQQIFKRRKLLPILLKSPEEFTPEESYSMGVIIADGSLSNTNQLSITLSPKDVEILEIVKRGLSINNPIGLVRCTYTHKRTGEKKSGLYSRLTWGYKYATAYWNAIGLYSDKTGNELWLPYMANTHFLRGLWDGDGGFGHTDQGVLRAYYSVLSKEYAEAVANYIQGCTGFLSIPSFSNGCYNLFYHNQGAKAVGDLIYTNSDQMRLKRKYERYRHNGL